MKQILLALTVVMCFSVTTPSMGAVVIIESYKTHIENRPDHPIRDHEHRVQRNVTPDRPTAIESVVERWMDICRQLFAGD